MGEAAIDEAAAAELRRALEETRAELQESREVLGEVRALLKQMMTKRKPRKPDVPARRATPELRQDVYDHMTRVKERKRRRRRGE